MGSGTFLEDFEHDLEFIPVAGEPNVHARGNGKASEAEPTAEEWDKFEKDVSDAFEQAP